MHKKDKERNKAQKKKRSERIRSKITQSQNPRETSFNKLAVVEQMYQVRVCARCWGYRVGRTQWLCSHEFIIF